MKNMLRSDLILRRRAARYLAADRVLEAISAYEQLVAGRFARPSDYVRLARLHESNGGGSRARAVFDGAQERFPLDANIHRQSALQHLADGRRDDAELAFSRAKMLKPDDAVLRQDLDRLSVGEERERFVALYAAFHMSPPKPASPSFLRRRRARRAFQAARAAFRARDWRKAIDSYAAGLKLDPFSAHAQIRFGHALKEAGDFRAAEAAYWRAVLLNPRDSDGYLQLGHVLKLLEMREPAKRAYSFGWAADAANDHIKAELAGFGVDDALARSLTCLRYEMDADDMVSAEQCGAPWSASIQARMRAVAGDLANAMGLRVES